MLYTAALKQLRSDLVSVLDGYQQHSGSAGGPLAVQSITLLVVALCDGSEE